jgi:hypothetical protein
VLGANHVLAREQGQSRRCDSSAESTRSKLSSSYGKYSGHSFALCEPSVRSLDQQHRRVRQLRRLRPGKFRPSSRELGTYRA